MNILKFFFDDVMHKAYWTRLIDINFRTKDNVQIIQDCALLLHHKQNELYQ